MYNLFMELYPFILFRLISPNLLPVSSVMADMEQKAWGWEEGEAGPLRSALPGVCGRGMKNRVLPSDPA